MVERRPPDLPDNVVSLDDFRKFQKKLGDTRMAPGPDTGQLVDPSTFSVVTKTLELLGDYRPRIHEVPIITERDPQEESRLFYFRGNPSVYVMEQSGFTLDFLRESATVYDPEDPALPGLLERHYAASLIARSLMARARAIDSRLIASPVIIGEETVNVADDSSRLRSVIGWRVGSGVAHLVMRRSRSGSSDVVEDCINEGAENRVFHSQAEASLARAWNRQLPDNEAPPISDEILGLANPLEGLELQRVIATYRRKIPPRSPVPSI